MFPRRSLAPALLLILSATTAARAAAIEAPPWSLPAEQATLASGATVVTDRGAVGSEAVRLAGNGQLTWRVEVPRDGRYEFLLRYRTGNRSLAAELVVNGRARGLGLAAGFGAWLESARFASLRAGVNEIAVRATGVEFDVDHLRFPTNPRTTLHPLEEQPEVSPQVIALAPGAAHAVGLVVHRNGHGTPVPSRGGRPVEARIEEFAALDDAIRLTVPATAWAGADDAPLTLTFPGGRELTVPVVAAAADAPFQIAMLEVSHGKCSVLRLPDGTHALVDTGTAAEFRRSVRPFLEAHGIRRLAHVIITHYHDDHSGGLEELKAAFEIGAVRDYRSFRSGETFDLGGATVDVLNAYDDGRDENSRSLSLRFSHRGFVYADGGDIYGHNQERILRERPALVPAHVYAANHHFHGSIDVSYLRRTDPVLFLVTADPAVYARGAFTEEFQPMVERHLKAHGGRLRETLLTPEVGHILVRAHDGDRWSCETMPVGGGVFAGFGAGTR